MDPFQVLPPELAVHVLRLVQTDVVQRPKHLRAALQVSRWWNTVGMQPDLWCDLDFSSTLKFDRIPVDVMKALLRRAQGGLRTLKLNEEQGFESSIWDGAVQEACALRSLISFDIQVRNSDLHDESPTSKQRAAEFCNTVGSPMLQHLGFSFSMFSDWPQRTLHSVLHGILERSVNLRSLCVMEFHRSLEGVGASWLPVTTTLATNGAINILPLSKLEYLQLTDLNPSVWEHLARISVKLKGVVLGSCFQIDELNELDPSGHTLRNIFQVIRGPQLKQCEFQRELGEPDSLLQMAAWEHPRRRLTAYYLKTAAGINADSFSEMENLELGRFEDVVFSHIFRLDIPRLSTLHLEDFKLEDSALATAISAVSRSLVSLVLVAWRTSDSYPSTDAHFGCPKTLVSISAAPSLRRLGMFRCAPVSPEMLRPLLIGSPHGKAPLCSRIHVVHLHFESQFYLESTHFMECLLESFRLRFPNEGIINSDSLCKPWKS
jgi:hypothetical protein